MAHSATWRYACSENSPAPAGECRRGEMARSGPRRQKKDAAPAAKNDGHPANAGEIVGADLSQRQQTRAAGSGGRSAAGRADRDGNGQPGESAEKNEGMATLKQARRLRQLGYMPYPVTDPRVAKLDEILVSLTRDKAGLIIRNMEGREAKKTWKNTLPAREFLAVSDDEFNKILARQLQAVNYGLGVRAQDVKGKVKR